MKLLTDRKLYKYFLVIVVFVLSCKKNEDPFLSGKVIGQVNAFDKEGTPIDKSGFEVSIFPQNSQIAKEGLISTITDTLGKFVIRNLKTGKYILSFSKPGFSERKKEEFYFIGGKGPFFYPHTVNLYESVETRVTGLVQLLANPVYVKGFLDVGQENNNMHFLLAYTSSDSVIHNADIEKAFFYFTSTSISTFYFYVEVPSTAKYFHVIPYNPASLKDIDIDRYGQASYPGYNMEGAKTIRLYQ